MITSRPRPAALLPISSKRDALLFAVETYPVTVVSAPTGSGKSTQIPQYLYHSGWCSNDMQVVISQPSRSAVIGTALHVADQLKCEVGQEVGYSIRWRNMASANTKIKYISDDLLLRELQLDPLLQRYSVVMIDDAHCRTLSTDLLLSLLKRILQKRTDLRVVVCGATAAVLQIVAFFNSGPAPAQDDTSGSLSIEHGVAKLIEIDDSPHTAELQRRDEPAQDYFKATVDTVFEVLATEDPGDILVVLTGKAEVYEAIGAIQTKAMELGTSAPELRLQPLHHGLGRDHQRDLFEAVPANARRIVVSDSIAETGVRLDNISFVVDCGYTKIRMYDSKSSVDCLVQMPISQMAAAQRAKQAGHSRAGKCFQVFTTEESDNLALQDIPEIQRSNFSPALLLLTNLGVANPVKFEYLTRPPDELMMVAAEYLLAIGAINEGIRLTQPLGLQIADIPLEPRMAKALLTSPEYACTSEMLSIAAMVDTHMAPWASDADVEDGFALHQRLFGVRESDHLTLLNIYTAFVDPKVGRNSRQWCEKHSLSYQTLSFADKIRSQLEKYLQKHNIDTRSSLVAAQSPTTAATKEESGKILRKCLLSGFCDNVAKRQADGSFRTVRGGRTVHAHKGSFASRYDNELILFGSVLEHEFKQTELLEISKIDQEWLPEVAPVYYKLH